MEALQWAVGILVTIFIGVVGFLAHRLSSHEVECKHVNARLAMLEGDMERAKEDIGTHNTGMRGHLHQVAQMAQEHELTLREMRRSGGGRP